MATIKFTIQGRVPSKKNSRRAIYVKGRTIMIANKKYAEWHKDASAQLVAMRVGKAEGKLAITILLYPPDRVKGDLSNKAESVMDLLVDCGVIEDDNWFVVDELILRFGGIDKVNPRAEVTIEG